MRAGPSRKAAIAFLLVAVLASLIPLAGCSIDGGASAQVKPTAQNVLGRAIDDFVSWKSYRYSGTSRLTVSGDARLTNVGRFDIHLEKNGAGAMDGHMVVDSEGGGSYETYSCRGTEYTRLEGQDWYRVDRGSVDDGYGMVSAEARRIIEDFARLVEDVRFGPETADAYTVSFVMGQKYRSGAAAIAGHGSPGTSKDITMTLTVDRKTMRMTGVVMEDANGAPESGRTVSITTRGNYSEINGPVDITPPAEALSAPMVNPEEAPPTQQYQ